MGVFFRLLLNKTHKTLARFCKYVIMNQLKRNMEMAMKIKEVKEYFELGVITGFDAMRDPHVSESWILSISGKEGRSWVLETAKGHIKLFSSLDTLAGEIESITGRLNGFHARF